MTPGTPAISDTQSRSVAQARGFTLIEAVMSMLIVGLMLVAALNTIGASRITEVRGFEQTLGPMLAEELMAEILDQSYEDTDGSPTFGREGGEHSGSRSTWDDVDDYTGWSASPPENKDGTTLSGVDGWSRQVEVKWVSSLDPDLESVIPTGIKRVDVVVSYNGRVVSTLSSLRTDGWPADDEAGGGDGLIEGVVEGLLQSLFK